MDTVNSLTESIVVVEAEVPSIIVTTSDVGPRGADGAPGPAWPSIGVQEASEAARDTALAYRDAAQTYFNSASAAATNAGNSASLASTKSTEASVSAGVAFNYANTAASGAATAGVKATEAATSATAAAGSVTAATAQAAAAASSATAAATSAGYADLRATDSATSASDAATASAEATAALASVNLIFDTFDDRFLGTKTSDPTVDNDGNALIAGTVYYNSTSKDVRFYNGTSWDSPNASATAAATLASTKAAEAAASATTTAGYIATATAKASEAAASATTAANNASTSTANASYIASLLTAAQNSASAASTSSTNASGYSISAGNSAATASNAATNASSSATNAQSSANAAASSATAAATSATNAATSASTASSAASSTATSAANASNSATVALGYSNNANTKATAAAASATAAAASATNAATSETNAASSASSAAGSAATATTQATTAATSATAAAGSASTATTQATAAAGSATAAAASATAAANAIPSLKTINGTSLIGTGDIVITGGGGGGDMFKSDNLSGLANIATARSNLGLAAVASSGSYGDLTGKPTLFSGAYTDLTGKPTLGTASAAATTDFATAAQGTKADTALQSASLKTINGNSLIGTGDITIAGGGGSGTVTSVGGTGTVSGLTLTGTVTSSGNLTLGGALNLSSPGELGATAPAAATFTTLTATGQTSLGGVAGSESLRVVSGAANGSYSQVTGTASYVEFRTLGTNANNSLYLISRGTGTISFFTNNSSTNEQFRVSPTASAVNYVQATGAATGARPTISAQGSDTNIDLALTPKGTGSIISNGPLTVTGQTSLGGTAGSEGLRVITTTNAVNYVQVTGAGTNSIPVISAQGTDTTVDLTIAAKGSGKVYLRNGTTGTTVHFSASGLTTSVNYINARGNTAGSGPQLEALGSDTNIDLSLVPKGTGKVTTPAIQINTNQVQDTITATTTAATANQVLTALDATVYRAVKFLIRAVDATGAKYHTTEILAVHNGTTANSTEYASVNIGGVCATFDVDYSAGTIRLLTTPSSANSTVFTVAVQLLK